jgi:protein TonB
MSRTAPRPSTGYSRALATSVSMHAVLLGAGAAWGLLAGGGSEPERRVWMASVETAVEPAFASSPEEELEPVFPPDEEPELQESTVWAEEEPPDLLAEPELVAADLEPPPLGASELELAHAVPVPADCLPARPEPAPVDPQARPERPGPAIVEARALVAPPPAYPRLAVRAGEEGTVLCHIHVGADGGVLSVEVVESSGSERLDRSAVQALSAWRFEPRRVDGAAVACVVPHRVTFRLNRT